MVQPHPDHHRPGLSLGGNLDEKIALGAEISPQIGLREKWESP